MKHLIRKNAAGGIIIACSWFTFFTDPDDKFWNPSFSFRQKYHRTIVIYLGYFNLAIGPKCS